MEGSGVGPLNELEGVTVFFGTFEHTLDAKGRLIVPALFRSEFNGGGFITWHQTGCLALWTKEDFRVKGEEMSELGRSSRSEDLSIARRFFQGVSEVEIDKQGRFLTTPKAREFARISQEIFILGMGNRIELWNPAHYELVTTSASEVFGAEITE